MSIEFTVDYKITGQDSLNSIYSGKHWSKRREYADMVHIIVGNALRKAGIARKPIAEPAHITISYPRDNVDIDNHSFFTKCAIDALKGWVITDDSPKYVQGITQLFAERKTILISIETKKQAAG